MFFSDLNIGQRIFRRKALVVVTFANIINEITKWLVINKKEPM